MNKKRVIITIGGLLAIGLLFQFILQKIAKNAIKTADKFIELAVNNEFSKLNKYCVHSINLQDFFNEEEKIIDYTISGYGIISPTKINVNYYVEGTPADQRNIFFILKKTKSGWRIIEISQNYHILRDDKKFAIDFVNLLFECNAKAFNQTKDINEQDFEQIQSFICKNNLSKIELLNGKIIVCQKKYCPENTTEAEFEFAIGNRILLVDVYHQNNDFWIKKLELN